VRLGSDLSVKTLRVGDVLVSPRRGVRLKVVLITDHEIWVQMAKGATGKWSRKRFELVPAEVIGWVLDTGLA
jgi:hypothetical protein